MFSGIVEAIGLVHSMERKGADMRLHIDTGTLGLEDVVPGDSIAVSGVCLTVTTMRGSLFQADVSAETLAHTTLGELCCGSPVNLEKALTLSSRLGGHLVSGHVDGVAEVVQRWEKGSSVRFRIRVPAELARYIAHKGSVCVDGVSLTVNRVQGREFELNIVPHTLQQTTMDGYSPGRRVNLEVDIIARYLERLLEGRRLDGGGVGKEQLLAAGLVRDNMR